MNVKQQVSSKEVIDTCIMKKKGNPFETCWVMVPTNALSERNRKKEAKSDLLPCAFCKKPAKPKVTLTGFPDVNGLQEFCSPTCFVDWCDNNMHGVSAI